MSIDGRCDLLPIALKRHAGRFLNDFSQNFCLEIECGLCSVGSHRRPTRHEAVSHGDRCVRLPLLVLPLEHWRPKAALVDGRLTRLAAIGA